jgi:hypothetical protein
MVNATEMMSAFPNKRMSDFVSSQNTEDFILECLKNGNSRFLGVENRDGLIVSTQRSGTWMHRVLAIKFAAWLSPRFELWVYLTIDQLLFGFAIEIEDSISESVLLEKRKRDLMSKLGKENSDFNEILDINHQLQNSKNRRRLATISKFKEKTTDFFSRVEAKD